jgi:acyl-CoA reductase-like NAD-dependent aldehyde dehydrogenase
MSNSTKEISYAAVMDQLRRTFRSKKTFPLEYRKKELLQLKKLLQENENELAEAIYKDIRRPKAEAVCFEVVFTLNDVDTALNNLDEWAKPEKVKRHLLQAIDDAYILKDPLGVVAIIGPWNYPVNLILCPLVGAIAAGNCVILKPSEIAAHTSTILAKLIPKYMDQEAIRVIEGGIPETTALLRERFDHIFYTGAPEIGKIIMAAASKNLTPVTLELGGKSPVIVDKDCDLVVAGRRIAWGKFTSCGQTCLAPDYVLCPESMKSRLIEEIKKATLEYYGTDVQKSDDYSRVISQRHFDRLRPLLDGAQIVFGGKSERSDLFIEPTIFDNVKPTDPIMQSEIFGPILPILTMNNLDDAIEFVNEREKPLALYIFSRNDANIRKVLKNTSSGGVTINDVIFHLALDTLPFGGVGNSGMGRYHGKYSFDTFTHEKSVLHRGSFGESLLWMRYPPYNAQKFKWSRHLVGKRTLPSCAYLPYLAVLAAGLIIGYFLKHYDYLKR